MSSENARSGSSTQDWSFTTKIAKATMAMRTDEAAEAPRP